MGEPIIRDDFLNDQYFSWLQYKVGTVKWQYIENTAHAYTKKTDSECDANWQASFVNNVYMFGQSPTELYDAFLPASVQIAEAAGLKLDNMIRMRLGLITRTPSPIVHEPHIDALVSHYTALIYLNDSDGDTVLYNETMGITPEGIEEYDYEAQRCKITRFTEMSRISPKSNRIMIFNGKHFHSSTSPTEHNSRLVMTINFTASKR